MMIILYQGSESNRIGVAFDTYKEHSIENIQKDMQGKVLGMQEVNITRLTAHKVSEPAKTQ